MPDMILTPPTLPLPPPMSLSSSTNSPSFATAAQSVLAPELQRSTDQADQSLDKQVDEISGEEFLERLKVPTVILETPSISHTMAATLSLSLLSHTLFLKSQIPFPVAQLSRMPVSKSNPKVAQKREELLATFDILASHFHTTFVALSTAYARCKSPHSSTSADRQSEAVDANTPTLAPTIPRGKAHLMFVLGSSVGAARARIVLTIDGLELKVWGARGASHEEEEVSEEDEESDEDTSDDEASEEETSDDETSDEASNDGESDEGSVEGATEGAVSDEDGSDDGQDAPHRETDEGDDFNSASEPPPSRSPSPSSPPARSLAPSPESLPSPHPIPTPSGSLPPPYSFCQSLDSASHTDMPAQLTQATQARAPSPPPSKPVPPVASTCRKAAAARREQSHAEAQQALNAAQRLLSRTLMNAWVDGEGDMSRELAPTQTHIFLRGPRRFAHPAWVARQNLTRALDGILDAFLEDAGAVPTPFVAKGKSKSKSRGVRTEGAWIGCRGGSAFAHGRAAARDAEDGRADVGGADEADQDEEDEEIWWTWERKLVGFADW
ncbi:hypothetical protein C8Q80DRAFT_1159371 [Daedaleopsis nitida]|nr:hypothetical protein C8Q80DRAFT_1159371 [Daedaleopsis nitida]